MLMSNYDQISGKNPDFQAPFLILIASWQKNTLTNPTHIAFDLDLVFVHYPIPVASTTTQNCTLPKPLLTALLTCMQLVVHTTTTHTVQKAPELEDRPTATYQDKKPIPEGAKDEVSRTVAERYI